MLTQSKKEFIEFMLSANVLRFGHFVTKSGRNTQYFVQHRQLQDRRPALPAGQLLRRPGEGHRGRGLRGHVRPRPTRGIPLASACSIALYNDYGIDKPYFFNRKEVKDHGEGRRHRGLRPPGRGPDRHHRGRDHRAGTAVRETMPILKACAKVEVPHMFISVDRCEVGHTPGTTAIMEVQEEFGIKVHPIVTVVGHPRVFERPRHRPGAAESHGGLHGAVLRAVT